MALAPIILFIYNRPWHTQQTLEALAKNESAGEVKLYVFADGPKQTASEEQLQNIEATRQYIRQQGLFKDVELVESPVNKGLAASVIYGVTEVLSKHDNAIILEDDMVTSPYFIRYMNEGLAKYEKQEEVISLHAYCVPISYQKPAFFLRGADCWGWATWKRGWQLFNPNGTELKNAIIKNGLKYEFDFYGSFPYFDMLEKQISGEVDSWAILWYASAFLSNKLTLYPSLPLVNNIGYDGSGTHEQGKDKHLQGLKTTPLQFADIPIEDDTAARKLISDYYFRNSGIIKKIKKLFRLGY